MLTVISVLQIDTTNYKRPVYSKMWVDKLYAGVKRNLDSPFRFVCLTNDLCAQDCEYEIIPLEFDTWGWWHKCQCFRQGLFDGACLYIDIDNVICKNITSSLENLPSHSFLCPREPYKDILNSSMIYWHGDYSLLYDSFKKNQQAIVDKYSFADIIGDQGFFKDTLTNMRAFDDYVDPGFFGWCHHKVGRTIGDPHVLIFTSTEKPTNNLDLDLVQKHWI
jgi:hypothetical protein